MVNYQPRLMKVTKRRLTDHSTHSFPYNRFGASDARLERGVCKLGHFLR